MVLISPSLHTRVVNTTRRCSGRLFLVHLRHKKEEDLIIVGGLYGSRHLRRITRNSCVHNWRKR